MRVRVCQGLTGATAPIATPIRRLPPRRRPAAPLCLAFAAAALCLTGCETEKADDPVTDARAGSDGMPPADDMGDHLDANPPVADHGADDAAPLDPDDGVPPPDAGAAIDAGPDATPPPGPEGWLLVWSDEFDAPAGTPIDGARWVHDVGGDGWGNQQLEFDTDRVSNSGHDGRGNLVITARREDFRGRQYTSARIKTQGRFARAFGRFEARIQLPIGQGIWPAFWLLGDDIAQVGWPQCGEIDVMEFRGQTPRESTGALHGPGYSAGQSLWSARQSPTPLPDDFHVFAVEWDPDLIVWTVDGEEFHRVRSDDLPPGSQWVMDHPYFIILNVAVGGTFLGPPDGSTVFPQQMKVDYVRVYERDPDGPGPDPGPGEALPATVDGLFTPSGYMGDGAQGGIEARPCPMRGAPDSVGACHGFRWTPRGDGWGGVFWQSPADNWGDLPGQPMPAGATEISFVAWGDAGGEPINFIAGYDEADGFAVETQVVLTAQPTRYAISLEGVNYDDVAAGFGWVTGDGAAAAAPLTFYVDDIQWR